MSIAITRRNSAELLGPRRIDPVYRKRASTPPRSPRRLGRSKPWLNWLTPDSELSVNPLLNGDILRLPQTCLPQKANDRRDAPTSNSGNDQHQEPQSVVTTFPLKGVIEVPK